MRRWCGKCGCLVKILRRGLMVTSFVIPKIQPVTPLGSPDILMSLPCVQVDLGVSCTGIPAGYASLRVRWRFTCRQFSEAAVSVLTSSSHEAKRTSSIFHIDADIRASWQSLAHAKWHFPQLCALGQRACEIERLVSMKQSFLSRAWEGVSMANPATGHRCCCTRDKLIVDLARRPLYPAPLAWYPRLYMPPSGARDIGRLLGWLDPLARILMKDPERGGRLRAHHRRGEGADQLTYVNTPESHRKVSVRFLSPLLRSGDG